MPAPPTTSALLEYALRSMLMSTNPGSRQKHERGYSMIERVVPDYNFIHVTRGKVVWVVGGEHIHLGPCDLVVVPPRIKHHAYCLTSRVTLCSLHIIARLPGGQDVFELLGAPLTQKIPAGSRLDFYLRAASDEWERPYAEVIRKELGWAHLVTHEYFRYNYAQGLLKPRVSDPLVISMLTMLEEYRNRPVTLAELARRAGYAPQHLNRVFRRALGVTPLQYLARLKLERAAHLLREGDLKISAIAQAVGFDDPYYFSRVFSQHFKKSPAEFRAQASSDSPSAGSGAPLSVATPLK
jgi:AraC-like DNA-binding protein